MIKNISKIISITILLLIGQLQLSLGQTTIKMQKKDGVYIVPCTVNGLKLKFIFDTGASDVSISLTEAIFMLKNDYLSKSDIIGTSYAQLANGHITKNTKIILRKIEFAGLTLYNVKASVVHELSAPLLLGQSAIKKLGVIQINPTNNTLTIFNATNKDEKNINFGQGDRVRNFKVTDIDGNVYDTVTIGTQVWLKENLNTTHYCNGDDIPNVTDNKAWSNLTTGAFCDYNNTENDSTIYGRLYNWYTIDDPRNLCPTGWHVPSDAEWTTLTAYLGGKAIAGGKLKEVGFTHWRRPNTAATNETGFTALPGGYRGCNGSWDNIRSIGHWWSSTESEANVRALLRLMFYEFGHVYINDYGKNCGLSVRCLKD